MAKYDGEACYMGWSTGSYRVFCAYWTASALSAGLTGDQTAVLSDYFSLISQCLGTIAIAHDQDVVVTDNSVGVDLS